ncbi:MAG: hypothetical protein HYV36_02155 [Lentisphaerae bacterium]|nr:hypothetical protein [Lentisphaerota bacterium]
MTINKENGKSAKARPDYRHAYPVFVIAGLAVGAALMIRPWLVPETFGEDGFYRVAAMDEEKSRLSRHVGRSACAECHADIAALHAKDAHASVECESCHGPGWEHVNDPTAALPRPNAKEDCLTCHRLLDARFGSFPQVDLHDHFQLVGVDDPAIVCTRCHSPHEPLYLDHDLRTARMHPLVHDCGECHIGRTDASLIKPAGHPAIFQCNYCHSELVKSFEKGAHAQLRCKACHLFIRETSFSGRIVQNADPRFCLLCHRKAEFKSPVSPPTIEWPAHIKDFSSDPPDPRRECVTCHQEQIHVLYSKEKHHGL